MFRGILGANENHTNKVINLHLLIILFASHCFYDVSAAQPDLIDDNFATDHQRFSFNSATYQFKIKNCTFTSCSDFSEGGGALELDISDGAQMSIINSTFTQCASSDGGDINAWLGTGGNLTISDTNFVECNISNNGEKYTQQLMVLTVS
ncbi:MAG: hypothetical protein EZS28_040034 [Streblomastix strix]|uniref:Cyanovirin-N domain-containing protein n=1 Tax=Streblomastix strix TaxID=222440 RepID=A0A5J4U2P8_9EUKA|nr:MAG: hypothetical protein EZS28_040034 [Streblomastix strix]